MLSRTCRTILISIGLGVLPQVALSQCDIDQAYEPDVSVFPFGTVAIGNHPAPFGDALAAQVFTVGSTGSLCRVDVLASRDGGDPDTGNLVLEIQTTTAGVPDGTVIASTSRLRADVPVDPAGFVVFDLPNPSAVTAGDVLAVVLRTDGEMCTVYFKEDAYPAGRGLFQTETIGWTEVSSSEPGSDLGFRTHVQSSVSVEETTWSALRSVYR